MNQRELRKAINQWFDEWVIITDLINWQFVLRNQKLRSAPGETTYGEVLEHYLKYKEATLGFDQKAMAADRLAPEQVEETVLHELVHVLLAPLTDLPRTDHVIEQVTTDVTRALIRAKRMHEK